MVELIHLLSEEPPSLSSVLRELERGADPNAVSLGTGVSPMHLAAGLGQDVLGFLIQYGGDPNVRSQERMTPLHVAASFGDLETVTLLLHNGANANLQDEDGKRPLDFAMENGHPRCIEELKIHTMLASVDDCSDYKRSSRNEEGFCNSYGHSFYFDNSCIDPEVLENKYARTITQEVYDYLSEGKRICFDATSPTTPLIGLKHKSCRTLEMEPVAGCGVPCSLGNVNHGHTYKSHPPQRVSPEHDHFHHSSPVSHRHTYSSYSPQKVTDRSNCFSHSPLKVHHECSCLTCCSQKLNRESPRMVNHESSSCLPYSPHREISGKTCTSLQCQLSAVNGSCLSHSPYRLSHLSLSSSHVPQKINHGPSYSSHSPQRMNLESPYPHHTHTPQKTDCGSSHSSPLIQRKEPANCDDIDSSKQPEYEMTRSNKSPYQIRNLIHSPKKDHKFFPPFCPSSSTNNSPLQRTDTDEALHFSVDHPNKAKTADQLSQGALHRNDSKHSFLTTKNHDNEECPHSEYFSQSSSNQSVSSSLSRVAEYVLSCTDFSSQCNIYNTRKTKPQSATDLSPQTPIAEKENLTPNKNFSENSTLSSSTDSFCTAENNSCTRSPDHTVNDETKNSNSTFYPLQDSALLPKDPTPSFSIQNELLKRWHPPIITKTNTLDESESVMTSENSFLITNRNKISSTDCLVDKDKNLNHKNGKDNPELQMKRRELGYGLLLPKIFNSRGHEDSRLNNSLLSAMSTEEFVHTDPESGITLVERWLPSDCGSSIVSSRRSLESLNSKISQDSQATMIYDWKTVKQVSKCDKRESLDLTNSLQNNSCPSVKGQEDEVDDTVIPLRLKKLSNEQLSQELKKFGEIPGPVIAATRQVYLKRLSSLEAEPGLVGMAKTCPDFPNELRRAMNGLFDWSCVSDLDMKMVNNFETSQGRQWREGCAKSSFTYLLLDPRVTSNLPQRAKDLSDQEVFKNFVCGIFYIGKGKRARPYCHLYEAVSKMKNNCKKSEKVQHILDIWKCNLGVISLHCFQSVIPVEAYTREACMLEAIGMHKVTNVKRGDFYGIVSTWPMQERRKLGVYLLHKAMTIFLAEGERQICLPDLKPNSQ